MVKVFSLLLLLTSVYCFCQENVKNLHLSLDKKTAVFPIVEEGKKQVSLVFNDKKNVRFLRFNESFAVLDSLASERPSTDYDNIVGYGLSGNKYYTYWSSSNNKEFATQCFDFENKKVSLTTLNLELEKEKPIEKITVNNIFYLITILKSSSLLNVYAFDNGKMTKKMIDLSDKTFLDADNTKVTLWEILNNQTLFEPALSIQNILTETPASLVFTANRRKAYVVGTNLIFTFDINNKFTQTIKINLANFSTSQKAYIQPYFEESEDQSNTPTSNSFLIDDKLVQLKLNSSLMSISVKDMEGNEIKAFQAYAEKDLPFKNSEIIQENGSIKDNRILDHSNQLLRKIYNSNPSLSCYTFNNKIYLVLGGVSIIQNNSAAMYGGMIGGFAGALIGAAISSNYSMNNVNSYANRKVVYINCSFDSNFNHVDGTMKKMAFDQLRAYAETNKNFSCQIVFKLNSALYYGGYNDNNYSFYKFND